MRLSKLNILLLLTIPDSILSGYVNLLMTNVIIKAVSADILTAEAIIEGLGGVIALIANNTPSVMEYLSSWPIRRTLFILKVRKYTILAFIAYFGGIDMYIIAAAIATVFSAALTGRWMPRLLASNLDKKGLEEFAIRSKYVYKSFGIVGAIAFAIIGSFSNPMWAMFLMLALNDVDYIITELLILLKVLEFEEVKQQHNIQLNLF